MYIDKISDRVIVCTTLSSELTFFEFKGWLLRLHCSTLQHTATHCNTLQHTATHYNTLQHTPETKTSSTNNRIASRLLRVLSCIEFWECKLNDSFCYYCVSCVLQCVAVCCSVLQCVAADFRECLVIWIFENAISKILFIIIVFRVCCSVLQCVAADFQECLVIVFWECTAAHCNITTRCNTLQHTATHCNTLQHTATHCTTLQHTATHCNIRQHTGNTIINKEPLRIYTATHCNTLQRTATHCNTLETQ